MTKKLIMVLPTMFVVAIGMLQYDPLPAGRIAQIVDSNAVYVWQASSEDLTLDPLSVIPTGMQVEVDGNDVIFTLSATTAGLYQAELILSSYVIPTPGWTGAPIEAKQTANIEWIVYDKGIADFLNGFGDVLVPGQ